MSSSNNEENLKWKLQEGTLTMFIAEVVGTGILIFIGCMGCIGTMGPHPPPPMQMAFTFGFTVNLLIMMIGHISGAHLNPAVTIGAAIVGLKTIPTSAVYILAQFIGATAGYGLLKVITPTHLFNDGIDNSTVPLCVTVVHKDLTIIQAILIETFCTGIILCTACATWDERCAHTTDSTALRFGFSVAGISFAASPYTGCSMNPARTFGPAFWNGTWDNQWVYWVGPTLGALLGTYVYQIFFNEPKKKRYTNHIELVEVQSDQKEDVKET
ncbi:GSCOCG00000010001-RA-CDS [Cotesia congregata]|uniref:Similar to AAEL003512: Aquaporin AQPAe.a (Aedes aegypti) n=1 Tax=Cotesia congregata TaxID=51543 RepID=A0A8J2HJE2_COTCN|nr:GSCOCG00000010001-RA-CDS [Cotesia congregata]CAG5100937.1 Similar to AAEL003512: Aquaporin AQPAe.a (Aedes aegypti) [Cotesia congregata]